MKKVNILVVILLVVTLILEAVNIYFANTLATNSILVTKLQQELEEIKDKNLILKSEILKFTSYEEISSKAAVLGFQEPKGTISLYAPPQVAVGR